MSFWICLRTVADVHVWSVCSILRQEGELDVFDTRQWREPDPEELGDLEIESDADDAWDGSDVGSEISVRSPMEASVEEDRG